MIKVLKKRVKNIAWYWHPRSVNDPYIMPWVHEEPKLNSNIIMPLSVGELLFKKRFVIIKHNFKHLIRVPIDAKPRIHVIDKQKTDYVMACYTVAYSVANTLNKFHIESNFYTFYKQNFYNDKRDKFDEIFDQYYLPLLKNIDHPALIQ